MEKVMFQQSQEDEGGSCVFIEDWGRSVVLGIYLKVGKQFVRRVLWILDFGYLNLVGKEKNREVLGQEEGIEYYKIFDF